MKRKIGAIRANFLFLSYNNMEINTLIIQNVLKSNMATHHTENEKIMNDMEFELTLDSEDHEKMYKRLVFFLKQHDEVLWQRFITYSYGLDRDEMHLHGKVLHSNYIYHGDRE